MSRIFNRSPAVYGALYLVLVPLYGVIYYFVPYLSYGVDGNKLVQSVYFSVVTITTLGYGDILPKTTIVQIIAASESLLGITLIGLFLNSLAHRRDTESQTEKDADIEREAHRVALARFRSHDSLVKMHIERLERRLLYITNPPGPADVIDGEIVYPEQSKLTSDFQFNNLKDIYKPSLQLSDDFSKPAVSYYFQSSDEFIEELTSLLREVEVYRWPDFERLCIEYLDQHKALDFRAYILSTPSRRLGSKDATEADAQMIEQHEGPVEFQLSNAKNPYIALYHSLRNTIEFLDDYKRDTLAILATDS